MRERTLTDQYGNIVNIGDNITIQIPGATWTTTVESKEQLQKEFEEFEKKYGHAVHPSMIGILKNE